MSGSLRSGARIISLLNAFTQKRACHFTRKEPVATDARHCERSIHPCEVDRLHPCPLVPFHSDLGLRDWDCGIAHLAGGAAGCLTTPGRLRQHIAQGTPRDHSQPSCQAPTTSAPQTSHTTRAREGLASLQGHSMRTTEQLNTREIPADFIRAPKAVIHNTAPSKNCIRNTHPQHGAKQ